MLRASRQTYRMVHPLANPAANFRIICSLLVPYEIARFCVPSELTLLDCTIIAFSGLNVNGQRQDHIEVSANGVRAPVNGDRCDFSGENSKYGSTPDGSCPWRCYSVRIVIAGSILAARRAGRRLTVRVMVSTNKAAAKYTAGSSGFTPNSCDVNPFAAA